VLFFGIFLLIFGLFYYFSVFFSLPPLPSEIFLPTFLLMVSKKFLFQLYKDFIRSVLSFPSLCNTLRYIWKFITEAHLG